MRLHVFVGNEAVGKTVTAESVAECLAGKKFKTCLLQWGRHDLRRTEGLNIIQNVAPYLSQAVVERVVRQTQFVGITEAGVRNWSVKDYVQQFQAKKEYEISFLSDALGTFFFPEDPTVFWQLMHLGNFIHQCDQSGYQHVVIDPGQLALAQKLFSRMNIIARKLEAVQKSGLFPVAEIVDTIAALQSASFVIVTTPDDTASGGADKVREIIGEFGADVKGIVLNKFNASKTCEITKALNHLSTDDGAQVIEILAVPELMPDRQLTGTSLSAQHIGEPVVTSLIPLS